jgi:hypothetical protein
MCRVSNKYDLNRVDLYETENPIEYKFIRFMQHSLSKLFFLKKKSLISKNYKYFITI